MQNFPIIPASKRSISLRKPVCGFGINDADYLIMQIVNGRKLRCQYYAKWYDMLKRAYCPKLHAKRPSYKDVKVCTEWLTFSNFRKWMAEQEWQGNHLDKDILIQGNKIYSPSTCLFVSHEINNLLTDCKAARGEFKIGASWNKQHKKYESKCRVNGKLKHLGLFTTEDSAHEAYKQFKYDLIRKVALEQTESLRSSLLAYRIPEY